MSNKIIRALAYDQKLRVILVENTALIQERCNILDTAKLTKLALAKTLSIACLVSGTLKETQRVSFRVASTEQDFQVLAEADVEGNVRGFVSQGLLQLTKDQKEFRSLSELFGEKSGIQVIKDPGQYGKMYTGVTKMPYGNITDDFSHYFIQSEQTTSRFHQTILFDENESITLSRGAFVQMLPGGSEDLLDKFEEKLEKSNIFNPDFNLINEINNDPEINILAIDSLNFACNCSKDLIFPLLKSLTPEDMQWYKDNNQDIEIVCNMCGEKYYFEAV